jgi:hypothetical protein
LLIFLQADSAWEHTKQAGVDAKDAAAGAIEKTKQTVEPLAETMKEKVLEV